MIWTICLLKKEDEVCLALKKRGHGEGRWNGTGGKPKEGETLEQTAIRETEEEIGVQITKLDKVAEIEFKDLPTNSSHFATAYIVTEWTGTPKETEEMRPKWFSLEDVPYDQMWSADKIWIPLVLEGRKIKAVFEYAKGDKLVNQEITDL